MDEYMETLLGSPEDVLLYSDCHSHQELIGEILDIGLILDKASVLSVAKFKSTPGIRFFVKGADGIVLDYSDYLNLLKSSSTLEPGGRARLVNPRWVDFSLLRNWKRTCDSYHGECLPVNSTADENSMTSPSWLVDCWRYCLIPASSDQQYVALSYVWGKAQPLKTLKSNLNQLRYDNSLKDPRFNIFIPQTIKDAILLTTVLGERYLWVDSLCIVQDDEQTKQSNIVNMGAIFSKASLTVIATNGNAEHGLRGLPGTPYPRDFHQKVYTLNRFTKAVLRRRDRKVASLSNTNVWRTRAWTFQEALFSRRCIFFHDATVSWICDSARCYEEETDSHEDRMVGYGLNGGWRVSSAKIPDLPWLGSLIRDFNSRDLSHPEDAHDAFAGALAFLCQYFEAGFIFGLPICLFEIALLWQPMLKVKPRDVAKARSSSFPTWSWLAWEGQMLPWPAHVKNVLTRFVGSPIPKAPSNNITSLVKWYYQRTTTSVKLEVKSQWQVYRQKYANSATKAPPIGWTRHEAVDVERLDSTDDPSGTPATIWRYFYKHDRAPEHEFAFPVPLCNADSQVFVSASFPLISCRTRRAWLFVGELLSQTPPTMSLQTSQNVWAGALQLHEDLPMNGTKEVGSHESLEQPFELVEISRSDVPEVDSNREEQLIEWTHDKRPRRGSRYESYDVLWVEWRDGIAYRKGLGRVEREIWEEQDREWFDLILG